MPVMQNGRDLCDSVHNSPIKSWHSVCVQDCCCNSLPIIILSFLGSEIDSFTYFIYPLFYGSLCLLWCQLFTITLTYLTFVFGSERELTIARLSVCLSSVTFVRPTQAVHIFGNISMAFVTLAIHWHPRIIFRDHPKATPPSGELNPRGVAKYSNFKLIDGYISETVQDRR